MNDLVRFTPSHLLLPSTNQWLLPGWPPSRTTDISTSGSVKTELNQEPLPDFWISPSMEHPAFARCQHFHTSVKAAGENFRAKVQEQTENRYPLHSVMWHLCCKQFVRMFSSVSLCGREMFSRPDGGNLVMLHAQKSQSLQK